MCPPAGRRRVRRRRHRAVQHGGQSGVGKLYVANTDARNDVRFEGHNAFGPTQGAPAGSVRGHFAESRITAIDPATGAVPRRHLNKHKLVGEEVELRGE
jgi:hypothetical protein